MMQGIKMIVLALLLSCCIRPSAQLTATEKKIADIQAMMMKEIETTVLEEIGGPEVSKKLVFINPTHPFNNEDVNITDSNSDFPPPPPPYLMKIIDRPAEIVKKYRATSDTHISLANNFKKIINKLDIEKPDLSTSEQIKYDEANRLMNEKIDGTVIGRTQGEETTKLEVYRHFRSIFMNAKQMKENEIEIKKETLTPVEYRRWYKYNYRNLKDNERSALQDWVVRGYKEIIDEALETVDTETPNVELDDAKYDYEAAVSEDAHGNIIYDAELSPSDWMKHLYDDIHAPTPTSSQYVNMITNLKEYSVVLQALAKAYQVEATDAQAEFNANEADVKAQEAVIITKAAELIKILDECKETGNCEDIDKVVEQQKNDTEKWKDDQADVDEQELVAANANSVKAAYDGLIIVVGDKINDYETKYEAARLEELAEDNDFFVPHEFPEENWKNFHFNSEIAYNEYNQNMGMLSEFQPEEIDKEFTNIVENRIVQSLELELDMHYISVGVNRPWFHGNLFENDMIKTNDGSRISPGYEVDNFIEEIKKTDANGKPIYEFPLYPTGLLIAKDIKMKIRGLNDEAGRKLIENSYNADQIGIEAPEISDDYEEDDNPFDDIGSIFGFTYRNVDSRAVRYRVRQDFNDIDIEFLEPQLIAQFCDIIPKK